MAPSLVSLCVKKLWENRLRNDGGRTKEKSISHFLSGSLAPGLECHPQPANLLSSSATSHGAEWTGLSIFVYSMCVLFSMCIQKQDSVSCFIESVNGCTFLSAVTTGCVGVGARVCVYARTCVCPVSHSSGMFSTITHGR